MNLKQGKLYKLTCSTLWYVGYPPLTNNDLTVKTNKKTPGDILLLLRAEYQHKIDDKEFYIINTLDKNGVILSCGSRCKQFINFLEEICH